MAEKMKFDFCGSVCYNKEYRAVAIFWYRKVLVLNFANPIRPGGGVRYEVLAQEEDLCRKSSLLISLENRESEKYYEYNKNLCSNMGSDAIIVTPKVEIIKDEKGNLLDESVIVSVITFAAPIIRYDCDGIDEEEYKNIFYNRIMGILRCAAVMGYKNLVLGALLGFDNIEQK